LKDFDTPCSVIIITSDKCYNNVEWVWGYKETDELGGPDPYSASKGAAEFVIRSYVQSYFPNDGAVRIAVGRAGNVIGGGDWADDRIVPDCVRAWCNNEIVSLRNPNATRPWQHVLEPLSGYINLAVELSLDNCLHGEPFNFGPKPNTDQSVGVLVNKMSEQWGEADWEDVSNCAEGPYESNLLKLNCDKALKMLKWHAVWDFDRTVIETLEWYKNYYYDSQFQIKDLSLKQIESYTLSAKQLGLAWAQ
jgi:CDP-glucose 4,6-dehydratase